MDEVKTFNVCGRVLEWDGSHLSQGNDRSAGFYSLEDAERYVELLRRFNVPFHVMAASEAWQSAVDGDWGEAAATLGRAASRWKAYKAGRGRGWY
jgi:hypothetical protein